MKGPEGFLIDYANVTLTEYIFVKLITEGLKTDIKLITEPG